MKIRLAALMVILMLLPLLACCAGAKDRSDQEVTTPDAESLTPAPMPDPEQPSEPELLWGPLAENRETLKILAIGNSFSVDCMQYLWQMLRQAGYREVILGNLYYGGCKLEQHLKFATNDSAVYTYYKNTAGSWEKTESYRIAAALADEDWDIITMQESSKTCGIPEAYQKSLSKLVDYVRSRNQTAKLVWNMTWAYQSDSTHSSFPNYGNNQMQMYGMILNCVQNYVMTDARFSALIPTGTTIQIARTSYLGDHMTRDGYHLNLTFGRYLAALTWACRIAGVHPSEITYNPFPNEINADMIAVAREAVAEGIAYPYELTISSYQTGEGSLS